MPRVYALADLEFLGREKIDENLRRMAEGGIRWIQIRAKAANDAEPAEVLEVCLLEVFEAGADSVAVLGAVCTGDVEANSRRLVARAGVAA